MLVKCYRVYSVPTTICIVYCKIYSRPIRQCSYWQTYWLRWLTCQCVEMNAFSLLKIVWFLRLQLKWNQENNMSSKWVLFHISLVCKQLIHKMIAIVGITFDALWLLRKLISCIDLQHWMSSHSRISSN